MTAEREGTKKKQKKPSVADEKGIKPADIKRKRDADAPQPVEGAAEPASKQPTADAPGAADNGASGPARKKRRGSKAGAQQQQSLDPEEAARRQRQREMQERASKVRAEGKTYVPLKKGGMPPKPAGDSAGGGGGGKAKSGQAKEGKGRRYLGDKTPGWRPFSSVEVIVLPIYWNINKEEKAAVIAASERARDILASAGISVDMDASNKYTPGQKMKYWETMGVRVRVELGPRDVANGNCVVALSTKAPGEVATKNIVNMRHKMLDAVRAALQKARSVSLGEDEDDKEEKKEQVKEEQGGQKQQQKADRKKGDKQGGEDEEDEEDVEKEDADEEEEEEDDIVAAAVAAVKSRQGGVLTKTANQEGRKLKKQRGLAGGTDGDAEEKVAASEEGDEAAAEEEEEGDGAAAAAAKPYSADALEDDFGDAIEFEPEEDKLTLTKKDRLKKAVKQTKLKRKAERRTALGGAEEPEGGGVGAGEKEKKAGWGNAKAAPKKPKVVKF